MQLSIFVPFYLRWRSSFTKAIFASLGILHIIQVQNKTYLSLSFNHIKKKYSATPGCWQEYAVLYDVIVSGAAKQSWKLT